MKEEEFQQADFEDFENYHSEEPVVKNWFEQLQEKVNKAEEAINLSFDFNSGEPFTVTSIYDPFHSGIPTTEEAEFEVVKSTLKQPKDKKT